MVPERILFQLWLPHLLFSRIHCFFFRPPTETMNRGFTVLCLWTSLWNNELLVRMFAKRITMKLIWIRLLQHTKKISGLLQVNQLWPSTERDLVQTPARNMGCPVISVILCKSHDWFYIYIYLISSLCLHYFYNPSKCSLLFSWISFFQLFVVFHMKILGSLSFSIWRF
jgi:hypothetical protein